jgi:hypothetical protein
VIEQKDDNVVEATAKVIKASEEKVVDNGGMMDYVQDVTVRILDGEYETEELEATYNLSYDIEGKIKGYPLEEGDKVICLNNEWDTIDITGSTSLVNGTTGFLKDIKYEDMRFKSLRG